MDKTEIKKIEIFNFYGGDYVTASSVAKKMRESYKYHAVWFEVDVSGPNGSGQYVKYIPK